uniref:Uncharacterized protein n=1 Tax=Ditylum brightwellii TaxID=49249 RepID=A0A7S4RAX8_9STRA
MYNNLMFSDDDIRRERERTFIPYYCDADTISTSSSRDIILDPAIHTGKDGVETTLKHGVAAYRNVLSEDTATDLRSWVMEKNKNHDITETYWFGVQTGKHREVLYPSAASHPSLIAALKELTSHALLVDTLEQLLGPNPAVFELSFITSYYGAAPQPWHQDLDKDHSEYGLTLAPSFSLFIPLQNTTEKAGASHFCPGTHFCTELDKEECDAHGFALVTDETNNFWKAGDGAMYSGRMYHRGGAHRDPHGPTRVLMIVSFTSRPLPHSEYRMPSLGTTWGIKYNMFGHTLQDLAHADTVMAQPWATLRAMGLYKLPGTDWGWDYVTLSIARMANLDPGFDDGDYEEFLKNGCGFVEDMETLPAWLIGDLEKYRSDEDKLFWEFGVETLDRLVNVTIYAYCAFLALYILVSIILGVLKICTKKKALTMNGEEHAGMKQNGNTKDTDSPTAAMNGSQSTRGKKNNDKNHSLPRLLLSFVLRISFLHIPILLMYIHVNNSISSSRWAHDINSNVLFKPPYPAHPFDHPDEDLFISYLRSVAAVRYIDVLFMTLLVPAPGSDGKNNAIARGNVEMNKLWGTIHEGNKEYYSLIEEFAPHNGDDESGISTTTPSILIHHAAKHIVQHIAVKSESRFFDPKRIW